MESAATAPCQFLIVPLHLALPATSGEGQHDR